MKFRMFVSFSSCSYSESLNLFEAVGVCDIIFRLNFTLLENHIYSTHRLKNIAILENRQTHNHQNVTKFLHSHIFHSICVCAQSGTRNIVYNLTALDHYVKFSIIKSSDRNLALLFFFRYRLISHREILPIGNRLIDTAISLASSCIQERRRKE